MKNYSIEAHEVEKKELIKLGFMKSQEWYYVMRLDDKLARVQIPYLDDQFPICEEYKLTITDYKEFGQIYLEQKFDNFPDLLSTLIGN